VIPGLARRLGTAAIATLGAGLFWLAGLPLPFLLGPLAACLVAALAGARLGDMGVVGRTMRVVLGVAVGASITPELLDRLPGMAYSVAFVPLFVALIGALGYPFFRRVCGYDRPTAYFAAMPGGLQDMLVFGRDAGGNLRTLSLIHATRVLVIVTLAPLLITVVFGLPLTNAPGVPARDVPPGELALMALAGGAGWWAAARVRLFGASILGPMIATAGLSLAGLIHHRPPAEVILAAQFFIGTGIGASYAGVTLGEIRRDVLAGIAYCGVLALVALAFAEAVALAGFAPPLEAFLAFAPGGQAEMVVLSLVAGADVAFVVTHHLVRLVTVIIGAPLLARRAGALRRTAR
jgi:membrane AbrB-like protein